MFDRKMGEWNQRFCLSLPQFESVLKGYLCSGTPGEKTVEATVGSTLSFPVSQPYLATTITPGIPTTSTATARAPRTSLHTSNLSNKILCLESLVYERSGSAVQLPETMTRSVSSRFLTEFYSRSLTDRPRRV